MEKVPYHLGIIMDGNRRWAEKRGLTPYLGHRKGAEKVKDILKWCKARKIEVLTLYAFSTENWQRDNKEVNFLIELFQSTLSKESRNFHREGIKFRVIGQKTRLPLRLQELIEEIEALTKDNRKCFFNLAVSYGGRAEIIRAIQKIIENRVPAAAVEERLVSDYLYTAGLPDPDLIIRTSGEMRTSGFLLWQAAYAELYFCQKYWPDFSEEDLDAALAEYAKRQRRFGK